MNSAEDGAKLFGGDASKKPQQRRVDPVWWNVIGMRHDKQRQRLQEDGRHLGAGVTEHPRKDLRQLLHFRTTATSNAAMPPQQSSLIIIIIS